MSDEPIYGRIKTAIDTRTTEGRKCESVYLGIKEWHLLKELCEKWGHDWPGISNDYQPAVLEFTRCQFLGMKIYRVDAAEHCIAI